MYPDRLMFRRTLLLASSALLLAGTAHAQADYPHGKLPDAATPEAYRLALTVIPEKDTFTGHTEIDIVVKAKTSSLFMHGRDLKISKAVAIQNGKEIAVTFTQLDKTGVARADFASPVDAGPLTLKFDYEATFGDNAAGLYHIKVGDDWYAWTQFESIDARSAFPSFDQPGYKTPFTVKLTTKPGFVTVSNAPETGTKPVKDKDGEDLTEHDFATTKPLPTYLVAMMVGPFVTKAGVVPPDAQRPYPLPIRTVATKVNAGKLDYVIAETPSIVTHLEAYFNMSFPFPKLDQIASPIMPGAMENAGADTYGDDIIMLDKGAPTEQKQEFGMVVSHELSHQWFGDYVTPAWWDDIWLNESFANWMGYRIGNEWRPELHINAGAIDEALRAMDTDSYSVGRPIHQAITENDQIDAAFDAITYGKGGQVVAMIAAYLGDDTFREGVRLHMSRHPYGNADSEQFFAALSDAAKDPKVLTAMKSFVDQRGVPTLDIRRNGGNLVVTQAPYERLGTPAPATMWTVPLCVRVGTERNCVLVDQKTQTVPVKGSGVIMPNMGGTGYYRFTLEPREWDALIASGDTISSGEGLAAIDSLWAQFRAGKGSADQLIRAARVFVNNPDSAVATASAGRLSGLKSTGIIDASAMDDYRRVMGEIYGPRLKALGADVKAGAYASDTPDNQHLRAELIDVMAVDARDPEIRKALDAGAVAYLGGDTNALDQAILGDALRVHVESGGLPTAKDLYERMLATGDENFRAEALGAVTAGATPDTAQWVFGVVDADTRLRTPDKLALISGLMREPATRDIAFDWLKANYDAFNAKVGIFSAGRVAGLVGNYCSVEKAGEADTLMRAKVQAGGRSTLAFDRTLEGVRDCGALKTARAAEVTAAFKAAK
jgi:aminopeptidase N